MEMLAMDRRNLILERIQKDTSVRVGDLAKEYKVTEETIRRDLEKLEKDGLVTRTYGGAVLTQTSGTYDFSFRVRETQNVEGKRKIALKVAEMIEDGDTLMVDSSTTAMFVVRELTGRSNITMITNSVRIPQEVAFQENMNIIVTGGTLRPGIMSLVGNVTEDALKHYYVNVAILGCKAMDLAEGTFEPHEQEAVIKRTMCENARQVIVVADHTKFGRVALARICDLREASLLITDRGIENETLTRLKKLGVQVEVV